MLKITDSLLRDLCSENDKQKLFGGNTILLCGDFWHILLEIQHGLHAALIENCVPSCQKFVDFHKVAYSQNMST